MKKNIIISFLVITNILFIIFGYAQRTMLKHQFRFTNRQVEIANQNKIALDSALQKISIQEKTIAHMDSVISELKNH